MIDINNTKAVTADDRREIINHALYTYPYFYRANVHFDANTPEKSYSSNVRMKEDFYLTGVQSNMSEVFLDSGAIQFNLALWTGYKESIYRWLAERPLHQEFLATDAPLKTNPLFSNFCDLQFEYLPRLIRGNDKVFMVVTPVVDTPETSDLIVVLAGFQLLSSNELTDIERNQIETSLASDIEWQIFKTATVGGHPVGTFQDTLFIENDRFPRIVYGMGAVNGNTDPTLATAFDINITDTSRRLSWMNTPIPLEFVAPRIPTSVDTNTYYLPIEYYWPPYAKLRFDVTQTVKEDEDNQPVDICLHTRTI